MMTIEKALAATLKDIGTALHTIGVGLVPGLPREYNTAKANYFYSKTEKDVKEQLAEINRMIEANNITNGRKVVVAATYLRDVTAE